MALYDISIDSRHGLKWANVNIENRKEKMLRSRERLPARRASFLHLVGLFQRGGSRSPIEIN
jgi:hypothetical protein